MGLGAFQQELVSQMADESDAYYEYMSLASRADDLGLTDVALTLRGIAADEKRHNELLGGLISYRKPTAYGAPEYRPFPKTLADWQMLADNIADREPQLRPTVDDAMREIINNSEYASGSQRQLLSLAGKLGIK